MATEPRPPAPDLRRSFRLNGSLRKLLSAGSTPFLHRVHVAKPKRGQGEKSHADIVKNRYGGFLSQTDVAVRLDKPQQFVSRYELGERRLDVFEYVDVAAAIGLEPITVIKKLLSQ